GTKVELRVRRVGVEQPITFKLSRATIHIRSVQVAMLLDDKVGFVQLSPVSETSAAELTHAVDSLVQKGMKSLILDLRYNPGALVHAERPHDPAKEQERSRSRGASCRGGAGPRYHEGRFRARVSHRSRPRSGGRRRDPARSVRRPGHLHDRGAELHEGAGRQDSGVPGRAVYVLARAQGIGPGE